METGPLDVVHPELYLLLAGTGDEASLRLAVARLPRVRRAKVIGRFSRNGRLQRRKAK